MSSLAAVHVRLGGGDVAVIEPDLYEPDRQLLEPLPQEGPHAEGLYLLHLEPRYLHAGRYLGYSADIARRIAQHRAAGWRSSPLVRAAIGAGSAVVLAATWPGEDRTTERRLKRQGGLSRHCPICRASGRWHR